jgi:hypothetical protein
MYPVLVSLALTTPVLAAAMADMLPRSMPVQTSLPNGWLPWVELAGAPVVLWAVGPFQRGLGVHREPL